MDLKLSKSNQRFAESMDSPLSMEEIQLIESTGLPAIDRHHLRLLAHSLACFKLMAEGLSYGPLPKDEECLSWLSSQPAFINEKDFIIVFFKQLKSAGKQLEVLADECRISPLELTLELLIRTTLGKKEIN